VPPSPDAIVVGAGIVGAACADALSGEGLRVLVLDGSFAGGGTTAAGMGHIVVMDDSEPQFALTALSRRLWSELAPELPPTCEDERTGTLWVAATEREMEGVRQKAATHAERGVEAEVIGADDLRGLEPALRPGLAGALRVPHDRVLYPPAAARTLLDRARSRGAVLRERCPVERITPGRAHGAVESFEAEVIINAAGPDAGRLVPGLPITPRKGHLVITDRYPGLCRHQLVELGYLDSAHGSEAASVAFNLQPRRTGQVLIGSSREFVGMDRRIHPELRDRMLRRAVSYVPALREASVLRTWVGFRPATPDNLPLIGAWEPGLFIAAGHEGLGITTSLATASILTDLILGRTPAIDPVPFRPTRNFGGTDHG